uniref:CSD domain-containing protein n=1 Tax=Rhodotorula toruloides TaxID=5286 RepID=A0A0K3CEP7_RHOTO
MRRKGRELVAARSEVEEADLASRLDEHLSSTKSPHAAVWTSRNSTRRESTCARRRSLLLFLLHSTRNVDSHRLLTPALTTTMNRTRSASYSSPKSSTGFDLPFDAPPSPPSSDSATPTRTRRHSLAGSRSPTPPLDLSPPILSSCFLPDALETSAAELTVPASPPSPRPTGLQGFQSVVSPLVYFDSYPPACDSAPYSPPSWQHEFQPYSPPLPQTPFEAAWQVDPALAGFAPPQSCFPLSGLGLYDPTPTIYPISSRTPSSYSPDLGCFPPSSPFGFSPHPFHFYPPPFVSTTGKTASQLLEEGEAFWSTGTCKFFDVEKGFGFIVDDHSQEIKLDVFAHYTGVDQKRGFRCLAPGERVEYVLTKLSNGKLQAFRIRGENGAPLQGLSNPAQAAAFDKAVGKMQDGEGCPQIRAAMKERALTSSPA